MLPLSQSPKDASALLERQMKRRQMLRQLQSLSKRPRRRRLMKRSRRASLALKGDPSPSNRLGSHQSVRKSQCRFTTRKRSPKKRRTDRPTKGDKSRQSQPIAMRRSLQRQLRRRPLIKKLKRRASRSPERQRRSQMTSSTMEVMPRESALKTKVISLAVLTPIQKATEAMETVVAVTMVVVLTINSLTIGLLTTAVVAATGCTTVACTRAGATEIGSSVRASTKDLVRLEHLVVPLSPQVMVVQEGRRLMTSSTIESISRSVKFQPGLLRRSNPESDELSGHTGSEHREAWFTRSFACL